MLLAERDSDTLAPPRAEGLKALGMPRRLVEAVERVLARRAGLLLVAGPPGSGVSTTLAALRWRVEEDGRSALAISDGERLQDIAAFDPDVVIIDLLRPDTAEAAVEAALDGRLVLAGIDAGGAVAALPRIRELGAKRFQLAAALRLVIAQRLARRLCPDCRRPVQAQGSVSALLGFDPGTIVYAAAGCGSCDGTGYDGRTGVFEAIHADAALGRLINDGGDEAILARHAFLNAPNLGSAARTLVREGVITPEEAVRISRG